MSVVLEIIKNSRIMKILKKLLTWLILPVIVVVLVYAIVDSIREPIEFNQEKAKREAVAIQRLKDIRDLQVAYRNVNHKYTASMDSLKQFYNTGKIKVVMQIGSRDDSLAVANTEALMKRNRRITPQEMLELYKQGEQLVFQIENTLPVRDTLFHNRTDFHIDSLEYIPFSGEKVAMESTVRTVSGVRVPLFEASMPYKTLLKGLDRQLIINLVAEREDQGRFPGLMVGSVSAPNNNAGNWE